MYTTPQGALIFAMLVALPLIFYGVMGFIRSEINMPISLRLFYVVRVPLGRINLAGASATMTSLGCLISGVVLALLTVAFFFHKVTMSAEILIGIAFVAILVAGLGTMLGFFVKVFTRQ